MDTKFECMDGTTIHFSAVRSLEIYYLDDIPVTIINGHRILNSKKNRKVAKLSDNYFKINNFKTIVKYEKMNVEAFHE